MCWDSIPCADRGVSLHPSIQTGYWTHPAYLVSHGGFSQGD